jgi:hypothetical protein
MDNTIIKQLKTLGVKQDAAGIRRIMGTLTPEEKAEAITRVKQDFEQEEQTLRAQRKYILDHYAGKQCDDAQCLCHQATAAGA